MNLFPKTETRKESTMFLSKELLSNCDYRGPGIPAEVVGVIFSFLFLLPSLPSSSSAHFQPFHLVSTHYLEESLRPPRHSFIFDSTHSLAMLAPTTFLSTLLIFFTSVQAAQRSFNLVHLKSEHDPLSRFKPNSAHLSPLSQVTVDHHSSNLPQSQAIQDGLPVRDPLVNFEVNVPPRIFSKEEGMESCTITLVERSFTNYSPSVLTYSPSKLLPTKCQDPEKWSHLVLSQYGTSRGRQFDRLGTVFLNGLEAWRTDNAEPVNTTGGVIWTTEKQIDQYYDFFSKDGTVSLELEDLSLISDSLQASNV